MKKIKGLIGAALALSLAFVLPVKVGATVATEVESQAPGNGGTRFGGIMDGSLEFMGVKVKVLTQTTTSSRLVNGEGLLYAICAQEGTLGKYSAAWDTGGEQVAGSIFVAANNAYKITPNVYTQTDTTSSDANKGCWVAPRPVKFVQGLYGGQNDSGHQTLYYVGCSDGDNPCSP